MGSVMTPLTGLLSRVGHDRRERSRSPAERGAPRRPSALLGYAVMLGLGRQLRGARWPALGAAMSCLAWNASPIHFGVGHRLLAAAHVAGGLAEPTLLLLLFAATASGIAIGRQGALEGLERLGRGSALAAVDGLAAASFGAYAANRAVDVYRDPSGRSAIAYRSAGPLLVALGGPVGAGAAVAQAQRAFLDWARRPVVWWGAGWTEGCPSVRLGQEAILRPATFGLEGRAMAGVRHSVTRARREGVVVERTTWAALGADSRRQVEEIQREWGRRRLPLRFSVSEVDDARGDGRVWVTARRGGRLEAFVTWLPSADGQGAVLDLLRRRRDAAAGCMELLICESMEHFRRRGTGWVSLGLSASAGLRHFKAKFRPEWHDRYLVSPSVPRLVALLAAGWVHVAPPPTPVEQALRREGWS
jgi:lysylphosphatidylglycerol synthetase-like protein (DUF2156 family)